MKKQIIMFMQVTGLRSTSLLVISYQKLIVFCSFSLQRPLTQNKCQGKLKFLFQQWIIYYHKHTVSKPVWEDQLNNKCWTENN